MSELGRNLKQMGEELAKADAKDENNKDENNGDGDGNPGPDDKAGHEDGEDEMTEEDDGESGGEQPPPSIAQRQSASVGPAVVQNQAAAGMPPRMGTRSVSSNQPQVQQASNTAHASGTASNTGAMKPQQLPGRGNARR